MLEPAGLPGRVWEVGALCRAVADALEARFNPVTVRGEITGFSRAASGHCYFSIKDDSGQIRCAMFRRAASLLNFSPRDGELVELRGRLGVYEARGDLQLVVESLSRAGQGALYEQFLKLRARLEAEGLFEPARKRPLPPMPRAIGVVTSLGAAALHDVVTALRRRVPHIPVVVAPAAVQGAGAPAELVAALSNLYRLTQSGQGSPADLVSLAEFDAAPVIDVIVLVRGGGSIEDLWAFNDEQLARTLARSPVPVVSGVGHETDFCIADFVADVRAPTPTAAAELVAPPREVLLGALDLLARRLQTGALRQLDQQGQRLDVTATRLGRPSALAARQRLQLASLAQRLQAQSHQALQRKAQTLLVVQHRLPERLQRDLGQRQERLARATLRLGLLDPSLVLRRGYAWLSDAQGHTVSSVHHLAPGQAVRATLADGAVDLTVSTPV
ncbi:MAG: exodeoxyribonuclease large subunit [Pseudomonadota bacterium]|jgi:exodeoxyribonuclease VII large subunit